MDQLKVMKIEECPCCKGKGELYVFYPKDYEDWLLELEFLKLELHKKLKYDWEIITICPCCNLPHITHHKHPESSCSSDCHAAWLKRGRIPANIALQEEVEHGQT